MGARWYDPALGRFISPDPIVPQLGNPQTLNRYAYALNNPVKYNDPTGHWAESPLDLLFLAFDIHQVATEGFTPENSLVLVADVACLILPSATGGGPGVRLAFAGGQVAARAVAHVPAEVRALQLGIKVLQFRSTPNQPPLPGLEEYDDGPAPGVEAEERVSELIGMRRNAGPNQVELSADHFTSKTGVRIPDFDPRSTPGRIVEVKDRAQVWLEGNLADFVEYARRNSLYVELWVRGDTEIDPRIIELTMGENPLIDLKIITWPN